MKATFKNYGQLMKFTLSFTVVFTCVICYQLAPNVEVFDWFRISLLTFAGLCITGSANAINQAVEKDTDAQMKRTSNRPVAAGRITQQQAYAFAIITGIVGVGLMWWGFNFYSALLSAFSLFLYAFIYTPLKKINSIAVLVGAFPGAIPCLIGWVAATNELSPFANITVHGISYTNAGGWALMLIQFLWQFPHFWAIAWVSHADYSRVGFKLLPAKEGPTRFTALQSIMYAVLMIPIGFLPRYFGVPGTWSTWVVLMANIFIVVQCVRLYQNMGVPAARRVMFSSYIYLPIVYLSLLADKLNYVHQ
jgi:protoheme IX farnesyltransferase